MRHKHFQFSLAAVVCFAFLLTAATAEAGLQGTATLMRDASIGVPFTPPDMALPDNWVAYALGLRTTAGEIIAGVDFKVQHGQLHQRWTDSDFDGVYESTANSTNASSGDSHLRTAVGALFGLGPNEDNSGVGSPLADTATSDYGLGTVIHGAWGLPQSSQGTRTSLAYIVIPKGTEPLLDIQIKVANPLGDILGDLTEFDFVQTFATGRVIGNGLVIDRGDTTPRPEDGTDFGLNGLGDTERRTFVVENTSTEPLSLGLPTFTGPFILEGSIFPSTVLPGATASFNVLMLRESPGSFLGSISFGSNSGRYEFALAGQVVPEPTALAIVGLATVVCLAFSRRRG